VNAIAAPIGMIAIVHDRASCYELGMPQRWRQSKRDIAQDPKKFLALEELEGRRDFRIMAWISVLRFWAVAHQPL